MLKNGFSPIMTLNDNNTNSMQIGSGDKVSDLFNNLVIPNWSLSYNYKNGVYYQGGTLDNTAKKHLYDEDEVMEESLHDKLLNLVKVEKTEMVSNKKKTKKNFKTNIKNKYNTTKKNKQK
jgi:hypothetical protein